MSRKALFLVAALFPGIVFAAAPKTWEELVDLFVTILNSGVVTLVILAMAIYFFGVASNILKFDEAQKRKDIFLWGILVLFVMVSVWGIVRLLQNTLFGTSHRTAVSSQVINLS